MLQYFPLIVAAWLAATVSGVAGFGGALLLLPVLASVVGAKGAVPVLTVAQLLGNASRAGFGWREIRWRPALIFSAGAVPASLLGARLFVVLPPHLVARAIGVVLLLVVVFRRTAWGSRPIPERALAAVGLGVGFLSAVAGSAGPLGAAVFLGLRLPPTAYVATEAVTAVLMHLSKSLVFGRYAALSPTELLGGLAMGAAMVAGSWTGRRFLERLQEPRFALLVEMLLVLSALSLLWT